VRHGGSPGQRGRPGERHANRVTYSGGITDGDANAQADRGGDAGPAAQIR
jgi:hypothetical protein